MQASKIVIGNVYAANYAHQLVRFRVESVTTTRKGKHPSDFTHSIHGRVLDEVSGDAAKDKVTLSPDAVLGPFEEHKALADRAKKQQEERQRVEKEQDDRANALARRLYQIAGLPVPDDLTGYSVPIRAQYRRAVFIDSNGVEAVLAALATLKTKVEA